MDQLRDDFAMARRVLVSLLIIFLLMALCIGVAGYTAGATTVNQWLLAISG